MPSQIPLREDPAWREALDWFLRVQAAPGDAGLRAARDAWLAQDAAHARAYARAEQVWRLTGALPATRPARRTGRRAAGVAALALAASLAFLLAPDLALRLRADHRTAMGETRAVALADGSAVDLDTASAIAVGLGGDARSVTLLAGRAFFQVSPDDARPFRVAAGDVVVTVTGTAFDVSLDDGAVAVAVQHGAVRVEVSGQGPPAPEPVALAPGETAAIDVAGVVTHGAVASADVASWRDGRLVVDGVTVAALAQELGRYHPGLILVRDQALAARRVTGVFDLADPLAALRAAVAPHAGHVVEVTPWLLLVVAG